MSGFRISGLGSGVDFSLYVDAIIKAEQESLARTLGRREVNAASKQAVFSNIRGGLNQLRSTINSFKNSGDFKKKVVSISNPNVVAGVASQNALNQSAKLSIQSLAANEVQKIEFTSLDSPVTNSTGEVSVNVRGTEFKFEVQAGTTLAELAAIINAQNIGITASAFDNQDPDDPNPAKLTITDNQSGIHLAGSSNMTFDLGELTEFEDEAVTTLVEASNAEVTINGQTVFSKNNVLTGVLPGLTLTLTGLTGEGEEVDISVNDSIQGSAQKIQQLVDTYNEMVSILRQATAFNPNDPSERSPTSGDSTLRNVLTRLQTDFLSSLQSLPEQTQDGKFSIRSMSDLGVTSNFSLDDPSQNGTLAFDAGQFNNLVTNKFEDVIAFFEGTVVGGEKFDGWVDKLDKAMDSFLNSTAGSVTSKIKSYSDQLNRISREKRERLEKIVAKEERLTMRFARLEGQLAQLNAQQSTLEASIQSMQLNNTAIARRNR